MEKDKPIKNPSTKSKNRAEQDLSDIENKLLECARNGKHVFLYGKNFKGRCGMVKKISKRISLTPKHINCRGMDGEDVYNRLTKQGNGVLFKHTGSLFANNLLCNSKKEKDIEYYEKLTKAIRKSDTDVKWIVVYASSKKSFPPYFRSQFEMIPLVAKVEKDTKASPLFMDIEKNILYLDKNKCVNLRPEEINLIEYLRKQNAFELEQILTYHFKKNLTGTYKHSKDIATATSSNTTKPTIKEKSTSISKGERNVFDTYKSYINKKCKPLVIGDLIVKGGIKKNVKISVMF
jgi:hypothetical protein